MEENIYRKARKAAAKQKPLLNNCESAQDLVYIERTKLLAIESGDKIPSPDDVVSMAKVYEGTKQKTPSTVSLRTARSTTMKWKTSSISLKR